uniref:response regulator n=1 Tax=Sphingomonas sp. TaxID=28214 RepID=UPI0025F35CD1
AIGKLTGGIAHDFNNLLAAVIGGLGLLERRGGLAEEQQKVVAMTRRAAEQGSELVRRLLAFARRQQLEPATIEIAALVASVSDLLEHTLGGRVELDWQLDPDLWPAWADQAQLELALLNLIINARDAMPDGGKIRLHAGNCDGAAGASLDLSPGDYVVLTVTDSGCGISPDHLEQVLEPFFTTKEVGKGTGLGLSTVYGIVKQSGGYIFADNNKGAPGTTFAIYLPVHTATAASEPLRAPVVAKVVPTDLWGTGTILLVEDEDMVRAIAERALSRQGYTVLTAEHGEAALEVLAKNERPDLLISDVMMPVMDGPTMVHKARERYPDLPVLFMSGYAEEQLRKSIDLDNVQFLAKPFSVQQLAEAARAVLMAK